MSQPWGIPTSQSCPVCGTLIGAVAGTKEAICRNCGFKNPCYE